MKLPPLWRTHLFSRYHYQDTCICNLIKFKQYRIKLGNKKGGVISYTYLTILPQCYNNLCRKSIINPGYVGFYIVNIYQPFKIYIYISEVNQRKNLQPTSQFGNKTNVNTADPVKYIASLTDIIETVSIPFPRPLLTTH